MEVELVADKDPFAELVKFIDRIGHPTEAEQRIVSEPVRAGFAENIIGEHSGTGEPWPQLSGRTNVDRKRKGYPEAHPMLIRRGILTGSYLQLGRPDHVEQLESTAEGWSLTIGSDNERAHLQEFGGRTIINNHEAVIPPRPITILSNRTEINIGSGIEQMIESIKAQLLGS